MTKEEIAKINSIDQIEQRKAEIKDLLTDDSCDVDALTTEVDELEERAKQIHEIVEKRTALINKVNAGSVGKVIENGKVEGPSDEETRAKNFADSGRMEMRALLSTGQIVKPTKAQTSINDLSAVGTGIVDDVHAVALTGNGSYTVPLKTARGTAVDAEEGADITGSTDPEFAYVTINPDEWATLGEVSKRIAQLSPVDYLSAVESDAVLSLRIKASEKLIKAILNSEHSEKKTGIPLDDKYLRKIALAFRPIPGKGATKLYLTQSDLLTLGDVRGTNEKKAVYEITQDANDPTSGTIKDGGLTVNYRIQDDLTDGTQLYGQPGSVDMPMWGNYSVNTDEGGDYFKHRTIGVLGTQLAGADLTAVHGMQIIQQAGAAAKKAS